jgi:predicted RNA polymerase sigma factor
LGCGPAAPGPCASAGVAAGAAFVALAFLAGIAAEHARAERHELTDWPAIVRWYQTLLRLDASPAPRLGLAIALSEAGVNPLPPWSCWRN